MEHIQTTTKRRSGVQDTTDQKSKENMKKVVAAASTISLPPLSVIAAAGDDFRFSLSHLCSPVRFQTTLNRLAAAFTAEGDYTALLLIL
jgi:hypothetical protein